jgi:hypothetical protein
VLDVSGLNVVEFSQAAVVIDAVLGYDKDGDAGRARRIAFNSRQNGMNDIRRQVVIAAGDEALGPGDQELPVGKPLGRGAQGAHIAARTGLRQAHRAAPFAGKHLVHILVLQLFRPVMQNQRGRAVGQAGIHQEGEIGGVAGLQIRRRHNKGQSLAADICRLRLGQPPGLTVFLVSVTEAFRHRYLSILERTPLLVAQLIGRQDDIQGHLFRFVHHHQNVVLGEILVLLRREQFFDLQLLKENEILIPHVHQ